MDNKQPLKGRWSGLLNPFTVRRYASAVCSVVVCLSVRHVTHVKFFNPSEIFATAESRVVKFCTQLSHCLRMTDHH